MQHAAQQRRTSRRFFIGWLLGSASAALGTAALLCNRKPVHERLGSDFLIVDGWILPSAYFK
ncbi:hypothetical protein [Comamonas badia]|uniref:hypothetical protein n=1 Tax=Comamonas badia TaxID=265291 RepID=UPI0012EC9C28|nr:hypothetical protein [Comamonas badia]